VRVVNLTYREPGCTGHPIIRLNNVLKSLKESEVLLMVNPDDIPVKVIELFVSRYGYRVSEVSGRGDYLEVRIVRQGG